MSVNLTMQSNNSKRRVFETIDVFIHILLVSIFVGCFGYPMVRDYVNFSTVFSEETVNYNDLPEISFVNLIAGSSTMNHGWSIENLNVTDEDSFLKDVCTSLYPNFSSTYREYIDCIDEQTFSADDLIVSWYNGER